MSRPPKRTAVTGVGREPAPRTAARRLDVRLAVNPILWSSDDFPDLGGDIPLERCLSEASAAGYTGIELGSKFPREATRLQPLLKRAGLQLASGWYSAQLLELPLDEERRRFRAHVQLMAQLGAAVAIVAECSERTYTTPAVPLRFEQGVRPLSKAEWTRLVQGLGMLAEEAAAFGVGVAYHPHLGTLIQARDEVETLLQSVPQLGLVLDTGHATLAGIDALELLGAHPRRVLHVHLKDIRRAVAARVRAAGASFAAAVRAGIFAVPGAGDLDFAPLLGALADRGYRGWLVVEADNDPARWPPLPAASSARIYLCRALGM